MTATLRKFLVFDVATSETRALKFLHRPRGVLRTTETSIRINNAGNLYRLRDITGELRDLRHRQQPNIRYAGSRIAQTGATNIERIESTPLDEAAHRGIEDARHR